MRLNQPRFGGFGCDSRSGSGVGIGLPCLDSSGDGVGTNSWPKASAARKHAAANRLKLHLISGLNSKRCKSCQTLYQSRMRTLSVFVFSLLLPLAVTTAKQRHCILRIHMEANIHDTGSFASSTREKFSGRSVAIEQIPRISEQDVAAFYPYHAPDGS